MRISDWSSDVCSSDLLQNQATSLVNEARNLQSLPTSTLQELQGQVDRTRGLLGDAQRVAFDVGDIQKAFDARYRGAALTGSQAALVANAEARWNDSVGAFQDAMKVQAGVVANMGAARQTIGKIGRAHVCTPVTNAHIV